MSIATAARNHFRIGLRRARHRVVMRASRVSRKIVGRRRAEYPCALVFSRRVSVDTVDRVVNAVAWHLGNICGEGTPPIDVFVPPDLVGREYAPPSSQADYTEHAAHFAYRPLTEFEPLRYQFVLHGDPSGLPDDTLLRALPRLRIVDESWFDLTAQIAFRAIRRDIIADDEWRRIRASSRVAMSGFVDRHGGTGPVTVCGSGPALSELLDRPSPRGPTIICNSIVRSEEYTEHLQPALICCADPVFHFGPSEYAATFRTDLLECARRYDAYVAVPSADYALLAREAPDLIERLIAVDAQRREWRIPSPDNVLTRSTKNVLTLLMIPMACSIGDSIEITGCDGRQKNENYFWKHNPRVQYGDLMDSTFDTHPAFFRDRVYTDYYEEHCASLEDQLSTLERAGHRFTSVTTSYIPALTSRAD